MAVSLEKQGKVGVIHLNRPPMNSYDRGFMDELNTAIDELRFDDELGAAVLVSDNPRIFSAGADVQMFQSVSLRFKYAFVNHANEIITKLERTPKVIIAAINGHALGGGLEIALACDLRFAGEGDYRLGLPEVALGLLPGTGGTQRLPRLVGKARAMDLMIRGERITPQQALEIGLVNQLFPADQLVEKSIEYANQLANGPTYAIGNIKLATSLGTEWTLEAGTAFERELVYRLFASEDAAEGMAAFSEKRKPNWKGQ
jgi:enoyl-CoA hydratase/carnithine racemase